MLKDAPPEELLGAIRTIHRGDAVIAPSATRRLLEHMIPVLEVHSEQDSASVAPTPQEEPQLLHQELMQTLSPREHEVLRLIAQGLSNVEISRALVLSEATIKTHVSHVLAKLDARDRVQAVIMAYEAGIVSRLLVSTSTVEDGTCEKAEKSFLGMMNIRQANIYGYIVDRYL